MPTDPISVAITYTAPGSPDVGQQSASATLDGPPLAIVAVSATELAIQHPTGQRLHLTPSGLRVEETGQALLVQLPADEQQLDLAVTAEPSETAARIVVTTKKESSKPDPVRRASFRS